MDIFSQIGNLPMLELRDLHDLQDAVLAEIERRNMILGRFRAKKRRRRKPASTTSVKLPATLPAPKRHLQPLSPRRRAA